MATRRHRFDEGTPVVVYREGLPEQAEFVRYVESRSGREADVRLRSTGGVVRVPEFAVGQATAPRTRWWWPSDFGLRNAVITTALTAVAAVAAVLALRDSEQSDTEKNPQRDGPGGSAVRGAPPRRSPAAGFTPSSRLTFRWKKPATYLVFNSITDNPAYGDERAFFDALPWGGRRAVDVLHVRAGDDITLRVFYDNSAAPDLGLVATNTRARILLPLNPGRRAFAAASISADNASPQTVSDTVTFIGDRVFTLAYVPGSARLWTNALHGKKLSDALMSRGVRIGYKKLDGRIPSGGGAAGWITVRARVHMANPGDDTG